MPQPPQKNGTKRQHQKGSGAENPKPVPQSMPRPIQALRNPVKAKAIGLGQRHNKRQKGQCTTNCKLDQSKTGRFSQIKIQAKCLIDGQFDCCAPWPAPDRQCDNKAGQAEQEHKQECPWHRGPQHRPFDQSKIGPWRGPKTLSHAKSLCRNRCPSL